MKTMDFSNFDCFKEDGNWYKGNLHSHTTASDGKATPEEVVDWYYRHGYDFLAITDHDTIVDVTGLQKDGMLVIPGIEFGYKPNEEPGFILDMLGINIDKLPDFLDRHGNGIASYDNDMSPQKIIDYLNSIGALAIMCHPYFMLNMTDPYMKYHSYLGMEVFNYACSIGSGRGSYEVYLDTLLYRGRRLLAFATDDSHDPVYGGGWIEVKAKEKTIPAIMNAIREGKFYSTTGIRIFDIEYSEKNVSIWFDRPCNVNFVSDIGKTVQIHENGHALVDGQIRYFASTEINPCDNFMRIELRDATGKKAYTNPVYLSDGTRPSPLPGWYPVMQA